MVFGFFLMRTDRVWRRNSCDPNVKFADELGVYRDIRTVTYGGCLNTDDWLSLRNFEWGHWRTKNKVARHGNILCSVVVPKKDEVSLWLLQMKGSSPTFH